MLKSLALLSKIADFLELLAQLGDAGKPLIKFLTRIPAIWAIVESKLADGELGDNDCDVLGREIAASIDIRVRMRTQAGDVVDVVDEATEIRLCRGIVRLARNVIRTQAAA